jgi:steroid 5-alpha reductase family enzyme
LSFGDLAPITLAAVGALMVAVWLLSIALRDASIVDIVWGLGFVVIAVVGYLRGEGFDGRRALLTVLTAAWGLRLALHLLVRNWGAGEDYRYRAMRRRWGPRFPLISLVTVFALQGVIMWVVSLPVQAAQVAPTPDTLTWVDAVGVAVWAVGLTFEVVGDWQLRRFKADPANKGKVMDRGLWRYTRHPNYFGDATTWWGLGIIAVAAGAWWSLVGPLVMTVFLMRVSGVPMLERRLTRTRPGYEEYARRTSAFVPLPPKNRGG